MSYRAFLNKHPGSMKSKTSLIIGLLLICKIGISQKSDSLWSIDEISNVTVYLYQQINDTSGKGGTGTIITHNNKYYLLTANHVSKEMKLNSKIVFRISGDKPGILELLSLTKDKKLKWTDHSEADVSIIELIPYNTDIEQRLKQWSFPSSLIYEGEDMLPRDQDVTFFGFSIIDLEIKHFSPLSFSAYLSSGLITNFRYDIKKKCSFFYLDKPSMQGCSGAGVYFSVVKTMYYSIKKTLLVGIVHGTAGDDSGGKLAAITPSFYIWELLKSLK